MMYAYYCVLLLKLLVFFVCSLFFVFFYSSLFTARNRLLDGLLGSGQVHLLLESMPISLVWLLLDWWLFLDGLCGIRILSSFFHRPRTQQQRRRMSKMK